ncbi:MAG: hypothetical protein GF331_19525 [Chitinivibrionales bacterium]|nr:hypothetical protein [Chitinivibrionales bacterium]
MVAQSPARHGLASAFLSVLVISTYVVPAWVHAGQVELVHDSICYRITLEMLSDTELRRLLVVSTDSALASRAAHVFDSLGYFAPESDTVSDTIVLTNGPRARLEGIVVCPVPVDDTLELPALPPTPRPYDAGEVVRFGNDVLRACAAAGYPYASLELSLRPPDSLVSTADDGVVVTMVVHPDQRHAFGPAVFRGTKRTKARQLQKDVRFRPGDVFDRRLVEETERRLTARDYIDSVRALPPEVEPVTDDTNASNTRLPRVVVPFEVRERSGVGLDGAIGLEVGDREETRLTGTLDFTLLNTFGVGERASLRYRGERGMQRLAIGLGKAYIGHVPVFASGSFQLELVEDQYAHLAGDINMAYELTSLWRVGAGLSAQENTVIADSLSATWHVYGVDFSLERPGSLWRRQHVSRSLYVGAGLGFADRGGREHTRWTAEFSADIHVPLGRIQGLGGRIVSKNLFTDEQELTPAEMYRVGGHESIRGYAAEQFAFRNVVYSQIEYLIYFGRAASAFIFIDCGLGFEEGLELDSDYTALLGYGLGVRIPVRIGSATIQWGRNIDDHRGLGRVHVRITNRLARAR